MEQVALGNVMVDCGDERALQAFYADLLGWERCELFAKPAVRSEAGVVFLFEAMCLPYGRRNRAGSKSRCILIFRLRMWRRRFAMRWRWARSRRRRSLAGTTS